MKTSRFIFILFIVVLIVSSCKTNRETITEYVYVEKTDSLKRLTSRIDSLLKETSRRDSIHEKDSVSVIIKGDTVMIDRWHTVYKEHSAMNNQSEKEIVHDTVYQSHTEYIDNYIDKEVIKEVNRLYWWQTVLMWLGVISTATIAIYITIKSRS